MGEMEHFSILVSRPEASAKRSRIARMHRRFVSTGNRKTTKSSAYREALLRIRRDGKGLSTSCASVAEIMRLRTSMATTNSMERAPAEVHVHAIFG
jgi:hypothetical protein